MRRPLIAIAVIALVFVGLGLLFATTDIGPERGDRTETQTITRSDGTSETVTIERDGRGGGGFFFFPFGFFIALFLFFALIRFAFGGFGRGRWGSVANGDGGPMRERFNQWHREEHEKMTPNAQ